MHETKSIQHLYEKRQGKDLYNNCPTNTGTAVAQWLRCCATNRKVAGSSPAGVSGF